MTIKEISRRSLGVCAASAALLVVGASGASAATCTAPTVTQPFSSFGDANWYASVPGESYDNFAGTGWTLTGGAKIVTTTLYDGTTGNTLYVPSGSTATSPTLCVTNDYPFARTMIRNVSGTSGVNLYVSYYGTSSWGAWQGGGTPRGVGTSWTLTPALNIHPSNISGWQLARFQFVPTGSSGVYELYNYLVDPRMH